MGQPLCRPTWALPMASFTLSIKCLCRALYCSFEIIHDRTTVVSLAQQEGDRHRLYEKYRRASSLTKGKVNDMANQEQVDLLKQGVPEVWNRWRLDHPDMRPDLQVADLAQANLSRVDLSSADLTGADLREADLNNANLAGANLAAANLAGANLAGANLSRADLSGANLVGADLADANVHEADFTDAYVRAANFSWTNVDQAIITSWQLKQARITQDAL